MNSKKIHYNLDNIDKLGARFNLIYRGALQWKKLSGKAQKRC